MKVKSALSNYAKKSKFEKCNRCLYIKICLKKVDLASLKPNVLKLDIYKSKN